MMLELMFFVFVILHTESEKIKILIELEQKQQTEIRKLIENLKYDPVKYKKFLKFSEKK